jgi:hypothetical protein
MRGLYNVHLITTVGGCMLQSMTQRCSTQTVQPEVDFPGCGNLSCHYQSPKDKMYKACLLVVLCIEFWCGPVSLVVSMHVTKKVCT